jgi:hypothetical protein
VCMLASVPRPTARRRLGVHARDAPHRWERIALRDDMNAAGRSIAGSRRPNASLIALEFHVSANHGITGAASA